jgi:hypothetical protein
MKRQNMEHRLLDKAAARPDKCAARDKCPSGDKMSFLSISSLLSAAQRLLSPGGHFPFSPFQPPRPAGTPINNSTVKQFNNSTIKQLNNSTHL